jgi:uncharacterized protein (TIGR04255 family)
VTVHYCENSTITEAWALLTGLPSPVDETDAAVIERTARAEISGLRLEPAIVAIQTSSELVAPFWNRQFSWDSQHYLARFGHRYLSLHFIRRGEQRYGTYSDTFEPQLEKWLLIYKRAVGTAANDHIIGRLGFGYVNTFDFTPEGFDLSRFFKLNLTVDVGYPQAGLLALNVGFRFSEAGSGVNLSVELVAESATETELRIATKIIAEFSTFEPPLSFDSSAEINKKLFAAKEAAKKAFFSFATPETHKLMGAVYDVGESSH